MTLNRSRDSLDLHSHFERDMQVIAKRWFDEKQLPTHRHYPYILRDHEQWERNVFLQEVAEYVKSEQAKRVAQGRGFPLHKYLHHGLSSQAMLFNLIGPLLVRQDWGPLKDAYTARGVPWPSGTVHLELENSDPEVLGEDPRHPTSLDFAILGQGGSNLYIEAKLIEKAFGGCFVFSGGDCEGMNPAGDFSRCYLHQLNRRYWPCLDELGFIRGAFRDSPVCLLAPYYQFFREVLFALKQGGCFVLLVHRDNRTFAREDSTGPRGLMPFLTGFVPAQHRDRIKTVYIQDVVAAIRGSGRHGDWIGEFEKKYGLEGN